MTGVSGGLFMDIGMTMVIEDGVIENNAAATDGGGMANNGDLALRDTKVAGNTANGQGGGIDNTSIVTVVAKNRPNNCVNVTGYPD